MKKLEDSQWNDFKGRFQNNHCPLCKKQTLVFSEPHFGKVAGLDVVAVTCSTCAHIELLNVAEISNIAKKIDEEYRKNNWR